MRLASGRDAADIARTVERRREDPDSSWTIYDGVVVGTAGWGRGYGSQAELARQWASLTFAPSWAAASASGL